MKLITRKWRNDFSNSNNDVYYDLFDDWGLIESSFLQQYGIRLRTELSSFDWGEFCNLLAGINGDTALGNIVRIRSEKDFKKIKEFSLEEKRIRNEWLKKNAKQISQDSEEYKNALESIKSFFKNLGGRR